MPDEVAERFLVDTLPLKCEVGVVRASTVEEVQEGNESRFYEIPQDTISLERCQNTAPVTVHRRGDLTAKTTFEPQEMGLAKLKLAIPQKRRPIDLRDPEVLRNDDLMSKIYNARTVFATTKRDALRAEIAAEPDARKREDLSKRLDAWEAAIEDARVKARALQSG